jgi:hypothetical protein
MDSGDLAALNPVPLKAVLSIGVAASLPPVDVPSVGEGLLYLGRLAGVPLHRLGLGDALCLRLGELLRPATPLELRSFLYSTHDIIKLIIVTIF